LGSVTVEGFNLYKDEVEAKRRMVFVPDVPRFYTELTAWEHLLFIAQAYNAGQGFEGRAERLLKSFDLWGMAMLSFLSSTARQPLAALAGAGLTSIPVAAGALLTLLVLTL